MIYFHLDEDNVGWTQDHQKNSTWTLARYDIDALKKI